MSLPRVTNALGTVSQLDDRPNDTGGLTAAELKAKFDKDSETLKKFLNNTLLPYLESASAAAQLGIKTIPGFSAADIQTALEEIVAAMQKITQGAVPNKSITLAKLAAEVTAAALGGAAKTHTHGAADVSSGVLNIARIPELTAAKLPNGIITEAKLGAAAVTAAKLAALAVQSTHIAQGAVTGQKIADGAVGTAALGSKVVTGDKISDKTIAGDKIVDRSITYDNLAYDAKRIRARSISGATQLLSYDVGIIEYPSKTGVYWGLNPSSNADLPVGQNIRLYGSIYGGSFSWSSFSTNELRVHDTGNRRQLVGESGSITIPANRYLDLVKTSDYVWMAFGNYADPMISGGTAAPSGGNNGDIYIQYSSASSANAVSKADVIGAADAVNEADSPVSEADAAIEAPEAM